MTQPDPEALAEVARSSGRTLAGAFAFGDSAPQADELLDYVTRGTKRATAASFDEQTSSDEPFPEPGQCWALLDGSGHPRFVMETTEVRIGRLDSVDPAFAWDEGEGDRTLEDWLDAHRRFFARRGSDDPDALQTIFERFRIVWPIADGPVWLTDEVREAELSDRNWVTALLDQRHAAGQVTTPDGLLQPHALPALIAVRDGTPVGLLTFRPWPDGTVTVATVDAQPDDPDVEAALREGLTELVRREGWTSVRQG